MNCDHKGRINLRVGYNGDLWYTCSGCNRSAHITERVLLRMIRRRLDKEQARDEQEQSAGLGAGGQSREEGTGERARGS